MPVRVMVGVVMAVVSFRAPMGESGREGTGGRSAARPRVRRSRRGVPEKKRRRGPTASRPTRTRAHGSAGGAQREGAERRRSWCAHDRPRWLVRRHNAKDAPVSYLETEASDCGGGDGG